MPIASDLPEGKELEHVMRLVDLREYLPMIDWIRNNQEHAREFVMKVAMDDPHYFKKIHNLLRHGDHLAELDAFIRANEVIRGVKMLRERLGLGLKEAKEMYDKRKAELIK